MRIYTVTKEDRPLAVVRAATSDEAIAAALLIVAEAIPAEALEVRDPNDAEMVGWIERRADYALAEQSAAA
jgi:hypothetical protein